MQVGLEVGHKKLEFTVATQAMHGCTPGNHHFTNAIYSHLQCTEPHGIANRHHDAADDVELSYQVSAWFSSLCIYVID